MHGTVISEHKQIGSACVLSSVVSSMCYGEGRLLMWDGYVHTLETSAAHTFDHRGKVLARCRQRHHRAVDAMLGQPIAMQHRRQRMADRPADHTGELCFSRQAHDAKTPSLRNWARFCCSDTASTE